MGSQIDLDQGGTFRQMQRDWMGPSVGWQLIPYQVVLPVTTIGTSTAQRGNSLITVNAAGAVTIQLPSSLASAAGPQAIPGQFATNPITITDISGNANTNNITILPFGTETIDGLASIAITADYGAFVLRPNIDLGGWTLIQ